MNHALQSLTISPAGLNCNQLLAEWRWIVPENDTPIWINLFGDWAFASPDGVVHFLDLIEGTYSPIASSTLMLDIALRSEENRNRWLLADWVEICIERSLLLARNQCYGWIKSPILGAQFEFSNIQVFDLIVYESLMGQVHRGHRRRENRECYQRSGC
jgi:hypothetical protein